MLPYLLEGLQLGSVAVEEPNKPYDATVASGLETIRDYSGSYDLISIAERWK